MHRFVYQSLFHPQLPLAVWEFMRSELQIGRKYVLMTSGLGTERLMRQLLQNVRVVCALENDKENIQYLNSQLDTFDNFLALEASPDKTTLQEDTIDGAMLVSPTFDINSEAVRKEFGRILRLNSYVLLVKHLLLAPESSFAQAYLHFLKTYSSATETPYSSDIPKETLEAFFTNDSLQYRLFPNQLRLDFEGLKGFYLGSSGAFDEEEHPQHRLALKALKILFAQYQNNGEVALDFETKVYYGLYNKYVPAISLRKSLFFNILRPFAFLFYVLVKLNIYFWRLVYRVTRRGKTH